MPNHKFHQLINEENFLNRYSDTGKDNIYQSFLQNLFFGLGRMPQVASVNDQYIALAMAIRDLVFFKYVRNTSKIAKQDQRVVAYLSAEYLPGPHLHNNLHNLRVMEPTRAAMEELDISLDQLIEQEEEPGLGNGGLGRLASCYLEAMANLKVPSIAYGIRYEFGIFDQAIKDGWQMEITDKWLHLGNPWEVMRPEISYEVKFGGHTRHYNDEEGNLRIDWKPDIVVKGVAHDTPIMGFEDGCSLLRLWKAEATESFDFAAFNRGNYLGAVKAKMDSENITKVLYPNDEVISGKELRLRQQLFFVSCSLQDIIALNQVQGRSLDRLHEKFVIQLNDTHPAISVAELMRLLVDEHHYSWEKAWDITTRTFAYTNHTLLPEALEKWPVSMFERLLPRHLEIIYEINHRFLETLKDSHQLSGDQLAQLSIIDESGQRSVRMAHLAVVGSFRVNGVSEHHADLLKTSVLHHFHAIWPDKFTHVTNGITQRRFLGVCNPALAALISEAIGERWLSDLDQLHALESFADDGAFQEKWQAVKRANKQQLAEHLQTVSGVALDPDAMFDIQAKRIHEYKRQHLKILHILHLYLELKAGKLTDMPRQAFIFAGKAAPSYHMAKLIIRLIHAVSELVNRDSSIQNHLKVVFMPDFNVKNAQRLYPAANLSEQISLAGKEASGTGNMKFALNGALTLGTLDGANVEIREAVGDEHFFLFGMSTEEVQARKSHYQPQAIYAQNPELRRLLDYLLTSQLTSGELDLFRTVHNNLVWHDPFMVLADFQSYHQRYLDVLAYWQQPVSWNRSSVMNVSRMGYFSADRSVRDYCEKIWGIPLS
jgi:starch phosphorylase